jgi:hypothetical protein
VSPGASPIALSQLHFGVDGAQFSPHVIGFSFASQRRVVCCSHPITKRTFCRAACRCLGIAFRPHTAVSWSADARRNHRGTSYLRFRLFATHWACFLSAADTGHELTRLNQAPRLVRSILNYLYFVMAQGTRKCHARPAPLGLAWRFLLRSSPEPDRCTIPECGPAAAGQGSGERSNEGKKTAARSPAVYWPVSTF